MNERDLHHMNEVLALVGGVLTIVIAVRVLKPDAYTQLRMRGLRVVSRTAKQGAETLTAIAANADTAYHRLTNVTV